jgi:amino acid permease
MNSDVKTPEAGENIPIDDTDHEIVGGRPTTIKRTLSRRHINMISLAGMIVSA